MDLAEMDKRIQQHVEEKYAGYRIEKWASGFGGGVRDVAYDVFLKDGSRFCVDAFYNLETGVITTKEKEHIQ
jgi:hypothetical protein